MRGWYGAQMVPVAMEGHGLRFWTGCPIRTWSIIPVNPIDDALRFITTIDNDGVAVASVGDHRTPHLEGADEKMFNPRVRQGHGGSEHGPLHEVEPSTTCTATESVVHEP